MKSKNYSNDFKIDGAIQKGIDEFSKEAGYSSRESSMSSNLYHSALQKGPGNTIRKNGRILKLFTLIKNIF